MNDFQDKIKNMSNSELKSYLNTSKTIHDVCSIICISAIVFTMFNPIWYSYVITFTLLLFFGNIAVRSDNAREYVDRMLMRRKLSGDIDK